MTQRRFDALDELDDRFIRSSLSGVLGDIADACGVRATLGLVRRFGGRVVVPPKRPRPDHPLAQAMGREGFRDFCHVYGGSKVDVPRARHLLLAVRDMRIRASYMAGTSVPALAESWDLSERRIWQILAAD